MFYFLTKNTPLPEPKKGDTALHFLGKEYKVENGKWVYTGDVKSPPKI